MAGRGMHGDEAVDGMAVGGQAERAIERVLHAYCRGIDRLDAELIAASYHPGGLDDHGDAFRGPVEQYVPWVLGVLRERFTSTMHTLTNVSIALDGDAARVESYLVAHHVVARSGALRVFGARYVDRFEHRTTGGWRIASRRLVPEWQIEHQGAAVPLPPGAATATRDRSDPSYG